MHWCPDDVPSQTFVMGGFACRSDKRGKIHDDFPKRPGKRTSASRRATYCLRRCRDLRAASRFCASRRRVRDSASSSSSAGEPSLGVLGISFAVLSTPVDINAMLLASLAAEAMPQRLSHTCFTAYSSRMGRLRDLPCVCPLAAGCHRAHTSFLHASPHRVETAGAVRIAAAVQKVLVHIPDRKRQRALPLRRGQGGKEIYEQALHSPIDPPRCRAACFAVGSLYM